MTGIEKRIVQKAKELKKCNAFSLKADFEAEGASYSEAQAVAEIAREADLNLAIKIGGCGARRDLIAAKELEADTVIAPMIESAYALEKFVEYATDINFDHLFINIETVDGLNNFKEIISSPLYHLIDGIICGRTDLAKSLGKNTDFVESDVIFEIAESLASEAERTEKLFSLGGGITPASISFINNIRQPSFNMFETRKVMFHKQFIITSTNPIIKALEFEILWLEYRNTVLGVYDKSTRTRYDELKHRLSLEGKLDPSLEQYIGIFD